MKYLFKIIYLFVLEICIFPTFLSAEPDFDHQRNIIPGSRAANLAGAYTAIARDPSGGYYNPAGIAFSKNNEVSVSVNSYQQSKIRYKNIGALNNEDFLESSSTLFPGLVGSTYQYGFLNIAWSYLTLDTKNIDQTDRFEGLDEHSSTLKSYTRTHQETNSYFIMGGSVAVPLGEYLSVGISGYYYRREITASNHQLVQLQSGGYLTSDQKYSTLNEGVLPVYGLMLRLKNISFGLSVREGRSYSDATTISTDSVVYQSSSMPIITSVHVNYKNFDELNPRTTSFGVAWQAQDWLLLSTDILYHSGVKNKYATSGDLDLLPIFNYSSGFEIKTKLLTLSGGLFTNYSQYKKLEIGAMNQAPHVNYWGRVLAFSHSEKGFTGSLTFVQQQGTGEAQKLSEDTNIQEVEADSLTAMFSAHYNFK